MEGCYEQLKKRIEDLRESSQDPMFTEYLLKLNNRLIQEKYQLDLIQTELDRSYQIYLKRTGVTEEVQLSEEAEEVPAGEAQVSGSTEAVKAENIAAEQIELAFQKVPQPQTAYDSQTAYNQQPVYVPNAKKKRDKEFVIGSGVFSIIGVFFVLAAFVMLGMYFMNGFVKGMMLYAIAMVVWLVSELLVRRKSQVLSMTLSSIGIAGLYIATIVNYIYMSNFNELVTVFVLLGITLLVFIVNRKKELGMIQMFSVAISTLILMLNSSVLVDDALRTQQIYLAVYFFAAMLLIEAILCRLVKQQEKNGALVTVYGISMSMCVFSCLDVLANNGLELTVMKALVMGAVAVMGVLFFFLMKEKEKNTKWTQLYFVYGVALLLYVFQGAKWEAVIALVIMLLFVKLMPRNMPVMVCNLGVTVISALYMLGNINAVESYLVLGAIILSVLFIRYWHTCFEAIITFTTVIFIVANLDNALMLPVVIAVLWLAVVLFNQVERFRGATIQVYNIMVLVCLAGCYLSLIIKTYEEYKIVYFILTVLGAGIIAFIFQEKNRMGKKSMGIVMAGFFTYMILVSRFTYDITTSVLLLLTGLISIGAGFYFTDKKLRIYGLIVSMLVCFKITLFDFRGEDLLQKMLLFLAAGVVALIISGIYVLLEKKYNK